MKTRHLLGGIFCVVLSCLVGMMISFGLMKKSLGMTANLMSTSFCKTYDTDAPVISLEGGKIISILVGEEFVNDGVEILDGCKADIISISGEVDTTVAGIYNIYYTAQDEAGNRSETIQTVYVVPEYRGRIYLTFDDGPGAYTAELLDVLAEYGVKATFFVTGSGDDELIAREYSEGHAVGLHTLSHNYAYIYSSADNFFSDLYLVQERVKNITGHTSYLMRFPGGSSNTVSRRYDGKTHIMSYLTTEVENRGFTYFDWNITSGDAGQTTDTDQIVANVTENLKVGGDSVVLQHDIKGFSVAAVERIIQYGLANGYVFDKLTAESFTAHHGVNN